VTARVHVEPYTVTRYRVRCDICHVDRDFADEAQAEMFALYHSATTHPAGS
jgi:hypothetical protein